MITFVETLESRQLLSTTFLNDQFSGTAINSKIWHLPTWTPDGSTFIGDTQFRVAQNAALPKVSAGAVHLVDDSYNPTGISWYGTELISNNTFKVGTGLSIKVRARLDAPTTGGIVGGLFMYMLKPNAGTLHDEEDVELLSNQAASGSNKVQTNVYANQPLGAGSTSFIPFPKGGKLTDFHTYEIRWYPHQVTWLIDGVVVRTTTSIVPTGPMQMYLNIWTPASDWAAAYNPALQPASNPAANKRYSMDVDYVTITSISTPAPPVATGIKITSAPPFGGFGVANGVVTGFDASKYSGVAVYIDVNGQWWTKPTWSAPLTLINPDGTWSAKVTTGGIDQDASEIVAYLIPKGFTVPLAYGDTALSASLTPLLHATVIR